jgi:putative membrane protein
MRFLLIRWLILAVAIGVTAWLMPGFTVGSGIAGLIIVAAVLGLINASLRPIVMFLTCPLIILTLGLFTLVVNALMLSLAAWLLPSLVQLDGLWTTLFASLIISIISAVLAMFVHDDRR